MSKINPTFTNNEDNTQWKMRPGWQGSYEVVIEPIPEPKIIDLSVVAGSRIPMFFGNTNDFWRGPMSLKEYAGKSFPYLASDGGWYEKCNFDTLPRAWVAWDGGDCPLPDGVIVEGRFRNNEKVKNLAVLLDWSRDLSPYSLNIIAFRVDSLQPGWRYEREVESSHECCNQDKQGARDTAINGYKLELSCSTHPEQYEVYKDNRQVGYLRLRGGLFRADYPDCGGETIYEAKPNGEGMFEDNERVRYLTEAINAIDTRLNQALEQQDSRSETSHE